MYIRSDLHMKVVALCMA